MIPLYRDPWFTFRFADDRLIPRFHLEGVPAGRRVAVFKLDPETGGKLDLLATALVGEGGWVDLAEPLLVRAGEGFVVMPDKPKTKLSLCETCRWLREVVTPKGSRFLLCQLSVQNPEYRKYPPQPVVQCQGYEAEGL